MEAMGKPTYGLYFRRYAPWKEFGLPRFHGDGRGPSTSIHATARTSGRIFFNRYEIVSYLADASPTRRSDVLTWFGASDVVALAKVRMTLARSPVNGPDLIGFSAETAGSNPLVPLSPDINTYVNMEFRFTRDKPVNSVEVSGEVFGDSFPDFEVFLWCLRTDRTALLLDARTTGGKNFGPNDRLPGTNRDLLLGRIKATLLIGAKDELSADYRANTTQMTGFEAHRAKQVREVAREARAGNRV
jgi:hypothetical protein